MILPSPKADVGDDITWPTSTGLDITVPLIGDFTRVSSKEIFAFSNETSVLTRVDLA